MSFESLLVLGELIYHWKYHATVVACKVLCQSLKTWDCVENLMNLL